MVSWQSPKLLLGVRIPPALPIFDDIMKNENVVIYTEVDVLIKVKIRHQKLSALYKRNKRKGIGWCLDNGDIPNCVFNNITKNFEPVENNRGLAYAYRNRLQYRKKYKQYT